MGEVMKYKIYSTKIDRRQGIMTDTGQSRRRQDKLVGFILGILLVFLLNWALGCSAAVKVSEPSRFPAIDCKAEPDAFRCQTYLPEAEIEYDQSDTEAGFEDVF
jgi:hypothetical protein